MDWLLPYYCAAALGAAGIPMPLRSSIGVPLLQTAAAGCADLSALDVELVVVLYEVLVEQTDCKVCGAPLDSAVDAEFARRSFTGGRVVVATLCRGSRRHRHVARVVERNGELRFGMLKPRNWLVVSGHREALT